MILVKEVVGPAFATSALINDDQSGLTDGDELTIDCWLEYAGGDDGWYVVDVKRDADGDGEDPWFGDWADAWRPKDIRGGDLITYVLHKQQTNEQLIERLMKRPRSGPLMQGYILEALAKYSELIVKATDDELGGPNAIIHPPAWRACAQEVLDNINEHLKR